MRIVNSKMFLMRVACMLCMVASLSTCGQGNVYAAEYKTKGKVDIELHEYEVDKDGKEIPYNADRQVLPGDVVSKIPRITNVADPCHIRVRWEYTNDSEEEGLSDKNIGGMTDDWIQKDGYYYYKKVLENKESVDMFKTVSFPAEWTEAHSLQRMDIPIVVEAIGLEDATPDYEKQDPWGGEPARTVTPVKTGDRAVPMVWIIILLVSFSGVVLMTRKGVRK